MSDHITETEAGRLCKTLLEKSEEIASLTVRSEAAERRLYLIRNERDNLRDNLREAGFARDAATAEVERLTKAIQNYLDGNYVSPRANRPGKCEHGMAYYEACELCVDNHFIAALTPAPSKEGEP